jgi:hypothetical protein
MLLRNEALSPRKGGRVRRANRFDPISPMDEPVPPRARALAERRVGGMVEEYNWQQTFSATLPGGLLRPTLLDIAVSAYLQGITDCAQAHMLLDIQPLARAKEGK